MSRINAHAAALSREGGVARAGGGWFHRRMTGPSPDLERLSRLLPGGAFVAHGRAEEATAASGAYALLIRLEAGAEHRGAVFSPGLFVYAGSARGPGGIRARLRRHFRPEKTLRWHVDGLTTAATRVEALAFPGGSECAIVRRLEGRAAFAFPAPGFGASDCRRCSAHLLSWGPER